MAEIPGECPTVTLHISPFLNTSEFEAPAGQKATIPSQCLMSSWSSKRKSCRLLCQLPNVLIVITERWEIPDRVDSVVFKHPVNYRLTEEGRFDVACTTTGHSCTGGEDK